MGVMVLGLKIRRELGEDRYGRRGRMVAKTRCCAGSPVEMAKWSKTEARRLMECVHADHI